MVNYYELLGISKSADNDDIISAIRKVRRLWNNRSNNPDGKIRAEAEQHIREIADAETILLDEVKRREYDDRLDNNIEDDPINPPDEDATDWEKEYFAAYNKDLNEYAAQIAQRAIRANERNGRAWFLYGEALRRSGNNAAAIEPLKHATMIIDDDAELYRQLGFAYLDADMPDKALEAFFEATRCNPKDCEYYWLRARILRNLGLIDEALEQSKMGYEVNPEDNDVRLEYFCSLFQDAMRAISYNRSSGKHLIINKVQLSYTKDILKTMAMVLPNDNTRSACSSDMEQLVKLVADAESKKGGLFSSKLGYQYNYEISNADTRATGKH